MSDADDGCIGDEFFAAQLGDLRRTKRLTQLGETMSVHPDESFPTVLDEAEHEGAYRLLNNQAVDASAILAPHVAKTVERAKCGDVVLAVHDTTSMSYRPDGKRKGLGRGSKGSQEFHAHTTLAVCGDGTRRPLGVLDLSIHVSNNFERWGAQIERVSTLGLGSGVIHVADREADDYGLMIAMTRVCASSSAVSTTGCCSAMVPMHPASCARRSAWASLQRWFDTCRYRPARTGPEEPSSVASTLRARGG